MSQTTMPARLSAADSLLWRIESDPVLRTPVVVVGLLDRSPTPEGVEATVERAAALLPRLGLARWPNSASQLHPTRVPASQMKG